MTEVDEVEEALALARRELSAPDAMLERVWQRVAPGAVVPAKPSGWAALRATGASGMVAAAVLAGGGFALGYLARGDAPAREHVAVPAPAPVVVPASAPALTVREERAASVPVVDASAEPASRAGARVRPQKRRAPKPRSDEAREELALLQRVERALRNEDAALALALLGELEQRFPRSSLREERVAATLMSHCMQQERGAGEGARAFLKQHPASVYRGRLRAVCALGSTDDSLTDPLEPDTEGPRRSSP